MPTTLRHTCIHDEVAALMPPTVQTRSQHPKAPRLHREEGAHIWAPLRITASTLDLYNTEHFCTAVGQKRPTFIGANTAPCNADDILTAEKRFILEKHVLPQAVATLGNALRISRDNPSDPLEVSGTAVCGSSFTIPTEHTTAGVANTDFVLYVAAGPAASPETAAWASACELESESHRPIVGRLNFSPQFLRWSNSSKANAALVRVAVHELIHALGFSSALLAGNDAILPPVAQGPPVFNSTRRDKKVTLVRSRAVLEAGREFFGCPSLDGVELEDEGGPSIAGSHWERRNLKEELMTGVIDDRNAISIFTLALFEDFGFYQVNYSAAANMSWGRNSSCSFHTTKCDEPNGGLGSMFCNVPGEAKCTYDSLGIGMCNVTKYAKELPWYFQYFTDLPQVGGSAALMDYCPMVDEEQMMACDKEYRGTTPPPSQLGNYFGNRGRCVETSNTFGRKGNNISNITLRCLRMRCLLGRELQIDVMGQWLRCPSNGSAGPVAVPKDSEFQGTIYCPPSNTICTSSELYFDGGNETTTPAPHYSTTLPSTVAPATTTVTPTSSASTAPSTNTPSTTSLTTTAAPTASTTSAPSRTSELPTTGTPTTSAPTTGTSTTSAPTTGTPTTSAPTTGTSTTSAPTTGTPTTSAPTTTPSEPPLTTTSAPVRTTEAPTAFTPQQTTSAQPPTTFAPQQGPFLRCRISLTFYPLSAMQESVARSNAAEVGDALLDDFGVIVDEVFSRSVDVNVAMMPLSGMIYFDAIINSTNQTAAAAMHQRFNAGLSLPSIAAWTTVLFRTVSKLSTVQVKVVNGTCDVNAMWPAAVTVATGVVAYSGVNASFPLLLSTVSRKAMTSVAVAHDIAATIGTKPSSVAITLLTARAASLVAEYSVHLLPGLVPKSPVAEWNQQASYSLATKPKEILALYATLEPNSSSNAVIGVSSIAMAAPPPPASTAIPAIPSTFAPKLHKDDDDDEDETRCVLVRFAHCLWLEISLGVIIALMVVGFVVRQYRKSKERRAAMEAAHKLELAHRYEEGEHRRMENIQREILERKFTMAPGSNGSQSLFANGSNSSKNGAHSNRPYMIDLSGTLDDVFGARGARRGHAVELTQLRPVGNTTALNEMMAPSALVSFEGRDFLGDVGDVGNTDIVRDLARLREDPDSALDGGDRDQKKTFRERAEWPLSDRRKHATAQHRRDLSSQGQLDDIL